MLAMRTYMGPAALTEASTLSCFADHIMAPKAARSSWSPILLIMVNAVDSTPWSACWAPAVVTNASTCFFCRAVSARAVGPVMVFPLDEPAGAAVGAGGGAAAAATGVAGGAAAGGGTAAGAAAGGASGAAAAAGAGVAG